MGAEPYGATTSPRGAWKRTETHGDLEWLENPTFISADCFKPPTPTAQPRAWERIAVSASIASRSTHTIHKRISARPVVDRRYCAVVTELESQSLDARKRARTEEHVVPYGGSAFQPKIRPEVTGQRDLNEARAHVKIALQTIRRDNRRLQRESCHQKTKRPSFDPAQLTWIPRKRHNTRWPIHPPTPHSVFIADLQPHIRFEMEASQIDEVAFSDLQGGGLQSGLQDKTSPPSSVPQSARVPEPYEPALKLKRDKRSHRRQVLRPSLSTISEATDETPMIPLSTVASSRSTNASPAKEWQATADTAKTPTKISEPPLNDFTISATPKAGDIEATNQCDQATVPPSPADMKSATNLPLPPPSNTESTTNHTPLFNCIGQFHAPSTIGTESTVSQAAVSVHEGHFRAPPTTCSDSRQRPPESSSTYVTALPFFDQPIPDVQVELEHESRRRFSLDAARRSDRTSNVRIMKRIHHWMAGSSMGRKRRFGDYGEMSENCQEPKRRHTLDVDAGMNPDIFGQLPNLPAPVKTPAKPVSAFHDAVEGLRVNVLAVLAVPAKFPTARQAKSWEQNAATVESEGSKDNAGDQESQETVEEGSDDEDVEGDSDMAYLQSFVQRSKNSKGDQREDVASAPILPTAFPKKRRSGSMSLVTSETGSPKARMTSTAFMMTTEGSRMPLGEKDANKTPSPNKKHKLKGLETETAVSIKNKSGRLFAPDLDDFEPTAHQRRKRRKGMESESESDDIFNPNMDQNQVLTQRSGAGCGTGSRRSSRLPTVQKTGPPAIPVRLPGSAASLLIDSGDMPAVSTAGITNAVLQRKAGKNLASETKANTRKNRGGAVPVQKALASMALRSSDGDETTTTVTVQRKVGLPGGGKTVRWDEILTRVQGEETVSRSPAEREKAELESASAPDMVEEEEQFPFPPQLRVVEPAPDRRGNSVSTQLSSSDAVGDEDLGAKKSESVRRSSRAATASRLPKRGGVAVVTAAAVTASPATPALVLTPVRTPKRRDSLLPAPSLRAHKPGGRSGAAAAAGGASEARARLGMAGPGTPAPRRGGRRGGRRG